MRQLESNGYSICTFSVSSTGKYALADADWNYKDVPHLNVIHTQVRALLGTVDDDVITTINLQKILGIPWPLTLVNYASSDTAQTYYTSLGPFVLVVHTQYDALGPNETKVTTTYNVGATGLMRLAFPFIRRVLTKNYKQLMLEDLPMRERRGELRARGFRFRSDDRARTFPETMNLLVDNVVAPERAQVRTDTVPLAELARAGTVFVGPDDDRGVRLVKQADELLVMPRVCSHEGAGLDRAELKNGRLSCPWHAKNIVPLARIALRDGAACGFGSSRVAVGGGAVHLTLPCEGAPPPASREPSPALSACVSHGSE
ncbi:MAG: Rieske 2Fe-2S domain-containing protein [Candidatus Eremiobacteraeota bacterium]|nr:Rieske 2Fe-2S domain-containing protein [Candidatus Eremiobacteraeota bacterium]